MSRAFGTSRSFGAIAWPLQTLGGDARARLEERLLIEVFGDRYREYMRRVRRTIPFLY